MAPQLPSIWHPLEGPAIYYLVYHEFELNVQMHSKYSSAMGQLVIY